MWIALGLSVVSFGAFLVSFYDGRAKDREIGGLKVENESLRRKNITLKGEISALRAPQPTRAQAGRVLDKATGGSS